MGLENRACKSQDVVRELAQSIQPDAVQHRDGSLLVSRFRLPLYACVRNLFQRVAHYLSVGIVPSVLQRVYSWPSG